MGNSVKTDPITTTYDFEAYPLGTEYVQSADENNAANSTHYGPKTWVFILAEAVIAEGTLVELAADEAPFNGIICATEATPAGNLIGVGGHAIASGKYGWVVKNGICECLSSDGGIQAREALVSHTSGAVDTFADGEEEGVIGVALHDDGSAAGLFTCKIFIP